MFGISREAEEGHTEVREEQRDCWNEEEEDLENRMRERVDNLLDQYVMCELDDDGDDDDDINESEVVDGSEVSTAHSCVCNVPCIGMLEGDEINDHRLTVQDLDKGEKEMYIIILWDVCRGLGIQKTEMEIERDLALGVCTAAILYVRQPFVF